VDPEEAKKNGDDDDDNESVSVSNVHENVCTLVRVYLH